MSRRALSVAVLIAICIMTGLLAQQGALAANAEIYVVDTAVDDPGGSLHNCGLATHNGCSFAGAINEANAHTNSTLFGADRINFQIAPAGLKTISPSTGLPFIEEGVIIDATGQAPGADNCGVGIMPCVRINGGGLVIQSSGVSVRGLAIWNFTDGTGINVQSGSNISILGNFLGTPDGLTSAQQDYGVRVDSAAGSVAIGGTTSEDRNLISGNSDGIYTEASDVTIEGNYIGTTASGLAALGNYLGVDMSGAGLVGGADASVRNVISGNQQGISINSAGVTVAANYVGTNVNGTGAVPNVQFGIGVQAQAHNTLIGGQNASDRNVISGNGGPGILMAGQATNTPGSIVERNYIGTNAAGMGKLANQGGGILLQSASAGIGAANNLIANNVISGNQGMGIHVTGADSGNNNIDNNVIGLNAGGNSPLGNQTFGIGIDGGVPSATIERNTISANYIGIDITQNTTGNIFMALNYIGTNAALQTGLGNTQQGIHIGGASGITIGSEAAPAAVAEGTGPGGAAAGGNVVRNNAFEGIIIESAAAIHDQILGNSIDGNGSEGLSIQGANNDQAPPSLTSAVSGGTTTIMGSVANSGNGDWLIEFFASPACDQSGNGEGRDFLGSMTLPAGAFTVQVPGSTAGQAITATATSAENDSSAFSNCVTAAAATPTPSPVLTPSPTPTATPINHPTPTPTPTGSAGLSGDANCDGTVDAKDAIAALSQLLDIRPGAECGDLANVDCDGDIDEQDALSILLFAAGTPREQPSGCGPVGA